MLTKRNGTGPAKLDLHVVGSGTRGSGTFSVEPVADPAPELSDGLFNKARDVVHSADAYVRHNPMAAVAFAALAAITAGYWLSRRN